MHGTELFLRHILLFKIICNSKQRILIFSLVSFCIFIFLSIIFSHCFKNEVIYRHIYNLTQRDFLIFMLLSHSFSRSFFISPFLSLNDSQIFFHSLQWLKSIFFVLIIRHILTCTLHSHHWQHPLSGFPFHLIYYFAHRSNESVIFSHLDDISTWKMTPFRLLLRFELMLLEQMGPCMRCIVCSFLVRIPFYIRFDHYRYLCCLLSCI